MENAQPEPSMEEILASIRRIISEDEDDTGATEASTQTVKPESAAKPVVTAPASPVPAKPVAEAPKLTEEVEMTRQNMASEMDHDDEEEILDRTTAEAATQAFRNLSQSVRISDGPGKTLEDIVVEMLRPMVKEWLDANLPAIVEEKVEEEVQRVARRRRS